MTAARSSDHSSEISPRRAVLFPTLAIILCIAICTYPDRLVSFGGALIAVLVCTLWLNVVHSLPFKVLSLTIAIVLISLLFSFSGFPIDVITIARGAMYLLRPLVFLLLGYLLARLFPDRAFLFAILLFGTFLTIQYVISYISDPSLAQADRYYLRRTIGTGSIITWLVVCSAAMLLPMSDFYQKAFLLIIALLAIFALVISTSRSGMIFIALVALVKFSSKSVRKAYPPALLLVAIASFAVTTPFLSYTFGIDLSGYLPEFLGELVAPTASGLAGINDQWRGYETARAFQYVFAQDLGLLWGTGLASSVPLGVTMSLGGELFDSIVLFHNAFSLVMVRAGILGLALYFAQTYVITRALGADSRGDLWILGVSCWIFLVMGSSTIQGFLNADDTGALGMLLVGGALWRKTYP